MDLANIRSGDAIPSRENNSLVLAGTAASRRAEAIIEEQNTIIQILRDTNGRVGGPNGAAARLGLKRTTLIERMKRLGIEPRRVLGV
jgi:transcriptional regulator with GAF, ATPase, and Fis domain